MAKRRMQLLSSILLVTAAVALLAVVGCTLERQMVFQPTAYPDGDWQPVGLEIEDVYFRAADGTALHGWYCPHPNPRAYVLWCHGNGGNLSYRAPIIRLWQKELGVALFIFDYRGYGRSAGRPSEQGLYADARAAYDWLIEGKQVPPTQLVLVGRSLGAAVATQVALEKPHQALILDSAFTSVPDVAREVVALPIGWMLRNRFDTAEKLARHRGPVLITHGTHDTIIPFRMGHRLYELAPEPKSFYAIDGAGHNDTDFVGGNRYFDAIGRFLDRWVGASAVLTKCWNMAELAQG